VWLDAYQILSSQAGLVKEQDLLMLFGFILDGKKEAK
jgi:hypothetical protein